MKDRKIMSGVSLKLRGVDVDIDSINRDHPKLKIVVPFSGGKDSQLCLKRAADEVGADHVIGLFCDTKWEHDLTYKHVENTGKLYGVDIYHISSGSVEEQVIKHKRFPTNLIRFCTEELKIIPSKKFYSALSSSKGGGFTVWYGMRVSESRTRAKKYNDFEDTDIFLPHEVMSKYPKYLGKQGVRFRLPIVNMTDDEVFEELGSEVSPMYSLGSRRVGCFPCLAENSKTIANSFNMDELGEERRGRVIILENKIGKKHETAQTSQVCLFCQI